MNQAQVDMAHTVIRSPIDGVVIARNVDVGQTVAASLQAPVLFVIANDLRQLQVNASIDEADVGPRAGRPGGGRSASTPIPTRRSPAGCEQVRLQPTTVQNVVTYNAIISVDNPQQRLMPGMTATVSIVVRRAEDVLRIPASALRFRPEGFDALAAAARRARRAAPRPRRDRGDGPSARAAPRTGRTARRSARPQLVFVLDEKGQPQPARVRLGISDGQFVEVREGLDEGARVVTGAETDAARGAAARPGASPGTSNPFSPQRPQRRQR